MTISWYSKLLTVRYQYDSVFIDAVSLRLTSLGITLFFYRFSYGGCQSGALMRKLRLSLANTFDIKTKNNIIYKQKA